IDLDMVEQYMLTLEQVECPLNHHFGPGICIRERIMPAGSFILGHKHKYPNLCMVLEGSCVVFDGEEMREITAPFMFIGKPTRKAIWALTETVWCNVFHTDLTDIDAIEAHFIEKSPAYEARQKELTEWHG
ncbi:MAG: hypothetical protein EB121_09090, partial [Alphaproteobacteria bacterium]|nr:hypothetical protein [Alphaproteobacteria bacterium]